MMMIFKGNNGISVSEIIKIYEYIKNKLEDKLRNCFRFLDENSNFGTLEDILEDENTIFIVNESDLFNNLGKDLVSKFISLFCIIQRETDYRYFTQQNIMDDSPLLKVNGNIHCGFFTVLLDSIYYFLYREIEKTNKKDNFYLNRHDSSVKQTLNLFKAIMKEEADYYQSIYENNDSSNEHDILIIFKRHLVIIEIKTSKIKEPRRNPEKAYQIIEQEFKKENGIQGGYNQAYRLKKKILDNEVTNVYNKEGEEIYEINRGSIDRIFLIIITADQFGLIASNLSLMLQKEISEPFPLCMNLFDLENLIEGFIDLNFDGQKFIDYLQFREKFHKIMFASDELEIAGSFIDGNNYDDLINEENVSIFFTPDMAKIFDDLYAKRN